MQDLLVLHQHENPSVYVQQPGASRPMVGLLLACAKQSGARGRRAVSLLEGVCMDQPTPCPFAYGSLARQNGAHCAWLGAPPPRGQESPMGGAELQPTRQLLGSGL